MRYLIISDIHANMAALETVLADTPAFDEIWCLGDMVGYGPNPTECIERIQEFPHICLAGNHDRAVMGRLDLNSFNLDARVANMWAQTELTPAARAYLSGLPVEIERDGFHIVHGSPREPVWEYILDVGVACTNFSYFPTTVCLVGHSHIPVVFVLDEQRHRCEAVMPPLFDAFSLGANRMILNPGSVGQPRDGDPRASYAMLDTENMTWELRRVSYPVEIVQERMRARKLPRRLISRLAMGR